MSFRFWQDLSTGAFADLDRQRTIAVLPLAATEQHGPHLPIGTDTYIAEGLLKAAASATPDDLDILVLPALTIGASLEHSRFPGTLSLSAAQLNEEMLAIATGVAAAGIRKLVLISAHGGNIAAMTTASLEIRARLGLLAVALTWARLGLPPGLIGDSEVQFGVHGGLVETALMLHFRPDLVDMKKAADFPSRQSDLADRFDLLRAYGPVGFGWLAGDLNQQGAVGNAARATAAVGAAIAAYQAERFARLLAELGPAGLDSFIAET